MKQEYGAFFIIAIIGALAYWYQSRHRVAYMGSDISNPVTVNAGEITPTIPNSITDTQISNDWAATPFYLSVNVPVNRGGSGIMPSLVLDYVPESFGAQEILPQF